MAESVDHDVAIVGAGAAGLAAAAECQAQGLGFRLIEARPRIGGRCITDHSLGLPVDLGASWIHAADQGNPWCEIASACGHSVLRDPHRRQLLGESALADAAITRSFAEARSGLFEWLASQTPETSGSVADFLSDGLPWRDVLGRLLGPWVIGMEPEAVDICDWALSKAGDDWFVPGGYGNLVARFAVPLPATLDCPVRSIEIVPTHAKVVTARGSLRASHVILTAPTSLLRAGAIAIRPALPASHEQALDDLPFSHLMKVALRFEGDPFGIGDSCGCLETTQADPACYYMVRPGGSELVYALIGGDEAWALEKAGQKACIDAALRALVRVFGERVRSRFSGGLATSWGGDPWARGTYSVARPGGYCARATLSLPVHGRLHFAGEANAPDGWQMTVAGAYLAGRAAARRIAAALRGNDRGRESD